MPFTMTPNMQYKLKGLKEQRGKIAAEVQKIGDTCSREQRAMNPDEREAFNKLQADWKVLRNQIEPIEADFAGFAEITGAGAGDDPERSRRSGLPAGRVVEGPPAGADAAQLRKLAFAGWCRGVHDLPLTKEQRAACQRTKVNPRQKWFTVRLGRGPTATRAMGTPGADGGYFIPQGFAGMFDKALKAMDGVRAVCQVMRTDSGNLLPYPTVDDTGNVGELLAENTETVAQDVAAGVVNFGAYKFSSKAILVSNELMQDSAFDLETLVGDIAGERIGRSQGAYFATGTGTGQPRGIVAGASAGVTAASATVIDPDELVRLYHAVDPAYRSSPSFGFMMHDGIKLQVALMKDGEGRPLFQASYRDGEPDLIFGKPVFINQFMQATVATGTTTVLCGDFSKFVVRDAGEVRVRRLDERYAEKDQTGFLAFLRSDSRYINAAAVKKLTQA